MKSRSTTVSSQTASQRDTTAFERFAKTMRALVAVPKRELDEMLAKEKVEKKKRPAQVNVQRKI